jgi:hypothetical protein
LAILTSPTGANGHANGNGNGSAPMPRISRVETVFETASPAIHSGRHMSMDEDRPVLRQDVEAAMWRDSVSKKRAPTITLKATRHLATNKCAVTHSSHMRCAIHNMEETKIDGVID